jgi:hypothetical protein
MDWLLLTQQKGLTKLKSWDAEVEEIQPLLARILELKNAAKKELNGTQLMVFLPSALNPATAGTSFKIMDVFECDRSFSSVQEGSRDKGSREKS